MSRFRAYVVEVFHPGPGKAIVRRVASCYTPVAFIPPQRVRMIRVFPYNACPEARLTAKQSGDSQHASRPAHARNT